LKLLASNSGCCSLWFHSIYSILFFSIVFSHLMAASLDIVLPSFSV